MRKKNKHCTITAKIFFHLKLIQSFNFLFLMTNSAWSRTTFTSFSR